MSTIQLRGGPIPTGSASYHRTHLQQLESEAVFVLREVVAQFERPVLLFSGGKDSIALLRLAARAFAPGTIPFPLLHIDTGHNFPETLQFRDHLVKETGVRLIVRFVQDSINRGRCIEESGPNASRNALQTVTLVDAIQELGVDAAIGGGRRDEEKARAKERIFSHRDVFGQWDPKNQRPELWSLLNGHRHAGEHFRAFPLSNWTELDVWHYVRRHGISLPSLYFAHLREVFERGGVLLARSPWTHPILGESCQERTVRFRTVGDATCTGAVESHAVTVDDVIRELLTSSQTERGATRSDDLRGDAAMEDRKRAGYF
jgi:sulfate adenylyltransferase subunit 2